jgi:hypothetical protein
MGQKIIFIIIIVVIIIAVVASILGAVLNWGHSLNRKEVHSDCAISSQIESFLGVRLPENAHHLYYARNRGLFVDHFAAFTLQSKEECEVFLADINYNPDEFHKTDALPQRLIDGGPESWGEEYADKNWQLTKEKEFLIAGPKEECIYIPDKCRIYLIHWAE